MSSSASHLPVLTTLCPICYTNRPKYRCPRCNMRTCSLDCTQTHRTRNSCSGVRDPAKFIPKREMQTSTLDMDYNFLKKVAKSKDEGRREVQKLDHGTSMTGKRKMHEARRKRWLRIARGRGVEVAELPKWMERRKANRTRFNKGSELLEWTVEWVIELDGEAKTTIDERLSETTSLRDALQSHIPLPDKEIHFLMRKTDQPANSRTYTRLHDEGTLVDSLQGLKISEFPTILVKDDIPGEWTIEAPSSRTR